eukprot:2378555-Alexandrium_andersonii.AAC.1
MRAELHRYAAAVTRPDWFEVPNHVRHLCNSMNFELAEAWRAPWTGAGWDWSHDTEWFVGFDGTQLR